MEHLNPTALLESLDLTALLEYMNFKRGFRGNLETPWICHCLWTDGFSISIDSQTLKIRVALLATVCDIPATQKIGGFCGHSSKQACWKCKKDLNRVDFSGVEIGDLRQHEEHIKAKWN